MPGTDDSTDCDTGADTGATGTSPPVLALDSSALMAPVEANVRLFEELDRLLGTYETVVPASVHSELEGLASGAGAAATAASVGADLATRARTVAVGGTNEAAGGTSEAGGEAAGGEEAGETSEAGGEEAGGTGGAGDTYADDALVALARANRVDYVVTNDRPLIERVLDADTPVICLRGRNTLTITEP